MNKKLLLTSKGITNESLRKALEDLLGKSISESKVAFIPTASYGSSGNKSWLVDEMKKAHDLGWQEFRVADFTAIEKEDWPEYFDDVDVIYMNGGNPYFLMNRIIKFGFDQKLKELIKTKVYVSSSAGGMITSSYFPGNLPEAYGETNRKNAEMADRGLGFVDFVIKPHMNSIEFPGRNMEWYESVAPKINAPFYAIDDQSGVKVIDDNVEVVSEGKWRLFNG